ncbi:transposase [Rhodosalinus sp.]|uniref:transposase n=1 Tax=Rhodosalinus sp. TaxID=2047741 RepID=UPI00397827C9
MPRPALPGACAVRSTGEGGARTAAATPKVDSFRKARDYAAWLGLTPQPHASGGKARMGRISKAGNRYLRRLPYLDAMAHIIARRCRRPLDDRLWRMLEKKPVEVVAVALSNRMARVVWALVSTGESYRANPA